MDVVLKRSEKNDFSLLIKRIFYATICIAQRYDEGSSQYNKVVNRLKVPSTEKLETMIEDETVSEAKQDYAIEYVYDTKQCLADSTFEFENVLFFMSGWCKGEAAFGNDESYESGTIVFYY